MHLLFFDANATPRAHRVHAVIAAHVLEGNHVNDIFATIDGHTNQSDGLLIDIDILRSATVSTPWPNLGRLALN